MPGISFNGTTSASLNIDYAVPRASVLPARKPTTFLNIPAKDGMVDVGTNAYENRIIPIDFFVKATSESVLSGYLDLISVWLQGEGWLIFDSDTTRRYWAKVYDSIEPTFNPTMRMFTVNFSVQPFAEAVTETAGEAVNAETDYGSKMPFYPKFNINHYDFINDCAIGNMANTGDWTSTACTDAVGSNILTATGNGSAAAFSEYGDCASALDITHKYYVYAKAQVTDASCLSLVVKWDGSTAGTETAIKTQATPAINTWYALSAVVTPQADFTGVLRIKVEATYTDAGTANTKVMKVKEMIVIDLTDIFGAGNEPLVATLDGYLTAYFTAQAVTWFTETPATYFTIALVSTGETIALNDTYYSFVNGDAIIVNCETGKVTVNGTAKMTIVDLSTIFFSVPTGNQTITVVSDGLFIVDMDYYKRFAYYG